MQPTNGTSYAMWANILGTLATSAMGITQFLPPQYAWVGAAIFGVNAALHAATGNAPIVGPTNPPKQ